MEFYPLKHFKHQTRCKVAKLVDSKKLWLAFVSILLREESLWIVNRESFLDLFKEILSLAENSHSIDNRIKSQAKDLVVWKDIKLCLERV